MENLSRGKVLDEAISSLKSFGEPGVDALIESFKKDDDFEARSTFAYVLGELGNPKAIEPLSEALEDTDFVVRTSATKSIEKLKKKKKQTKY